MTRTLLHSVDADQPVCRCPGGRGIPIGTFVDQVLTRLERRHLRATGCYRATEYEHPEDYLADVRARPRTPARIPARYRTGRR